MNKTPLFHNVNPEKNNEDKKEQMDCVLFASPVHIVTAWPIAPHKQGYNIVWERGGGGGGGVVYKVLVG